MSNNDFESRFQDGITQVRGASPGVRDVLTVSDVAGNAFKGHPDTVMLDVGEILRSIGRIYRYGNNIVLEKDEQLLTLAENGEPTVIAASILANYFLAQGDEDGVPQPPTRTFLQHVFNSELVLNELPVINRYVKIPTYDEEFTLLQPGYDPESGTLVHGELIAPIPFTPTNDPAPPIRDRAPAIIRDMFVDFPFATPLDFLKAVGLFLVGLLATRFTSTGRPIGLLDGNQPGIGKTLLASCLGVILDGSVPTVTEFSCSNDELSKRILATLRSGNQSVILIDNARAAAGGVINSTSLEAMAVTETLSLRVLGTSANHVQPNDFMWLLSMNGMKTTPDLAQRGILIRLAYEGPASSRRYHHNDLIDFVKEHRMEIIATFYGMIEHWKSQGRPDGQVTHRFNNMARIIGGILDACGLSGFLTDHQETVQSINSTAEDLTALFDAMINSFCDSVTRGTENSFFVPAEPTKPGDLVGEVVASGIATEEMATAKSSRAKATKVGQIFSRLLNTPFPVEVGDRAGTAMFCKVPLRGNQCGYHFHVELEPRAAVPDGVAAPNPAAEAPESGCPF